MKSHIGRIIIFFLLFSAIPARAEDQATGLDVAVYDLSLRLDLEQSGAYAPLNTLSGTAAITFTNRNELPVTRIPVVLYRLLQVEEIRNERTESLKFTQQLARLEGWEKYQANVVTVDLDRPLRAGGQTTIEIDYTGQLVGIRESGMLYVQDSLDPDFTIIRAESAVYPQLADPTEESLLYRFGRGGDVFDQVISVTVPEDVVVASGLILGDKQTKDGFTTWQYRSRDPNTQIILPIARYEVIESVAGQVYYFPADREGAQRVAEGIVDARRMFEEWFGPLHEDPSFAVVEIPTWYGSQALRPTVILDARAFQDATAMPQLYHEISHFWNVRDPSPAPSRWDEGLAMYLQEVVQGELGGNTENLVDTWNNGLQRLKRELEEHPEYRGVPLVRAGERNLTSVLSYRAGQLMFALLEHHLGRGKLLEVLGDFYQKYAASGATSEEFGEFVLLRAPSAKRIIDEWFLGSDYSDLVLAEPDFDALVLRYHPK